MKTVEQNNEYQNLLNQIVQVISNNSEQFIAELDNEILNWVDYDAMNEDEYDDEYAWYHNHSNGEAGDAVYESTIKPKLLEYLTEEELDSIDIDDIYEILNDELSTLEFN